MTKSYKCVISLAYILIFWALYRWCLSIPGNRLLLFEEQLSYFIPTFLVIKLWSGSFQPETQSFFGVLIKFFISIALMFFSNPLENDFYLGDNYADNIYTIIFFIFVCRVICVAMMTHVWRPSLFRNDQWIVLGYALIYTYVFVFYHAEDVPDTSDPEYIAAHPEESFL